MNFSKNGPLFINFVLLENRQKNLRCCGNKNAFMTFQQPYDISIKLNESMKDVVIRVDIRIFYQVKQSPILHSFCKTSTLLNLYFCFYFCNVLITSLVLRGAAEDVTACKCAFVFTIRMNTQIVYTTVLRYRYIKFNINGD